jgi:hypothetical protein
MKSTFLGLLSDSSLHNELGSGLGLELGFGLGLGLSRIRVAYG